MIAQTTKNGITVRLSAEYMIDVGKAYFKVYSKGTRFTFEDFSSAANVYKRLTAALDEGIDYAPVLCKLIKAARLLGNVVVEPGFDAEEKFVPFEKKGVA